MTLRDDVRKYFELESQRFPTPAGLRSEVFAQAAAAPGPGLRPVRWEAITGLGIAVAIVLTLIASGWFRHHEAPTPVPAHPTATPRQVQFASGNVLDADLVNSSVGWSLVRLCSVAFPNSAPTTCRYMALQTLDGGRTWSAPSVVADLPADDDGAPSHIHFFNQTDGFVYGPGTAFATTDGGKTWFDSNKRRLQVLSVVGRDGLDWMIGRPCAAAAVCSSEVQVSNDGGRTWPKTYLLPAAFIPTSVVAFSVSGLLIAGPGVGNMNITFDGGVTWLQLEGRCPADALRNSIATFDGQELWQLCIPRLGNATLFVSPDAGKTWDRRTVATVAMQALLHGVVAIGPGQALLLAVVSNPYITSDSGLTWKPVQAGDFVSVAVCASGAAWARDSDGFLWFTSDVRPGSGSAWATLPSQP